MGPIGTIILVGTGQSPIVDGMVSCVTRRQWTDHSFVSDLQQPHWNPTFNYLEIDRSSRNLLRRKSRNWGEVGRLSFAQHEQIDEVRRSQS